MRVVVRTMLVASLLLGAGLDDAHAKGKGKGKKGKDDDGILLTGIEAFDDVFVRVGEIDQRLTRAERSLKSGQRELNTSLELKRGTPFTDAVAELKKRADNKLELTLTNMNAPKLGVSDAVPTNVQTSVDAFNALTLDITSSLDDLASIGPEIDSLVKASKDFPAALKDEFKKDANWLDMIFALPKTSKALSRDIGITTALPGRAQAVTSEMVGLMDIVKSEFQPAGGGGNGRNNGGGGQQQPDDPVATPSGTKPDPTTKPSGGGRAGQGGRK